MLAETLSEFLDDPSVAEQILEIYKLRNRVAHGEHRFSQVSPGISVGAHELLCRVLEKVLERNAFPTP
jgi:hypothetical protein